MSVQDRLEELEQELRYRRGLRSDLNSEADGLYERVEIIDGEITELEDERDRLRREMDTE